MSTYVVSGQVESWGGPRTRRRGWWLLPCAVTMSVLLAACGSTVADSDADSNGLSADPSDDVVATSAPPGPAPPGPAPPGPAPPAPAAGDPAVGDPVVGDPGAVLTGQGLILQKNSEPPIVCLGGVDQSYPPQCSGPELVGLDWADVSQTESASGVTWGAARVVGTYDGQTFTLTEPPSEMRIPVEPDGGTGADPHPQLCDDPFRGGDEQTVADPNAALEAQEALGQLLEGYEGYVGSWVSTDLTGEQLDQEVDYVPTYNVLVTGDAEQARVDFRAVWPGGLCVEQRDAATQAEMRQAQQAVAEAGITGIQSSGGSGAGRLQVSVLLADAETVQAIHTAAEPWLTPEQVDIHSSLVPVQPQS